MSGVIFGSFRLLCISKGVNMYKLHSFIHSFIGIIIGGGRRGVYETITDRDCDIIYIRFSRM